MTGKKEITFGEALKKLKALSKKNPKNIEGMKRFGINPKTELLCISMPDLRKLAKSIGKNHSFALKLWQTKIHEARILGALVAEPEKLTEAHAEQIVKKFDAWDVCDQTCMNLFDKTSFAWKKAGEWTKRNEEFVKRAGFALLAVLAVHDKTAEDKKYKSFFPAIEMASADERNFVKKAVNWALRQIGKRNKNLNKAAIELSKKLLKLGSKSAKWIAGDALRELASEKIQRKIKKLKNKKFYIAG